MNYETVIGLEVHAQLRTESKMFCGCPNRFGAQPNTRICPVCLGLPGTLPVLNRQVVEFAIRTALAFHCEILTDSVFARKNYFYPDLPKGYQISQYDKPLALGGYLEIENKKIRLVRIHMEEDAGKLVHEGVPGADGFSFVDYNRTGVPLLEIVGEPDIRSPEEAGAYLRSLRSVVRYLDVCDGNMEEGSLRCDANVSVCLQGSEKYGTRVEIKNMNSFKSVEAAIQHERDRQIQAIEIGERIVQETRLWDVDQQKTFPMRSKEEAHDYRYFPEPDLIPVRVDSTWVEKVNQELPELPDAKRRRFSETLGLSLYDASALVSSKSMANFFEQTLALYNQPKRVSNWILSELLRYLNEEGKEIEQSRVTPSLLAEMLQIIDNGTLSGKMAKEVFKEMCQTGDSAPSIVEKKGFKQVTDESAIVQIIDQVLARQTDKVREYKAGREKLFGFFVGEVMKATRGQANPQKLNALLKQKLSS